MIVPSRGVASLVRKVSRPTSQARVSAGTGRAWNGLPVMRPIIERIFPSRNSSSLTGIALRFPLTQSAAALIVATAAGVVRSSTSTPMSTWRSGSSHASIESARACAHAMACGRVKVGASSR